VFKSVLQHQIPTVRQHRVAHPNCHAGQEQLVTELIRFHFEEHQLVDSSADGASYKASEVRWGELQQLQLNEWDHCRPVRWLRYPEASNEYEEHVLKVLHKEPGRAAQARDVDDEQPASHEYGTDEDHMSTQAGMLETEFENKARRLQRAMEIQTKWLAARNSSQHSKESTASGTRHPVGLPAATSSSSDIPASPPTTPAAKQEAPAPTTQPGAPEATPEAPARASLPVTPSAPQEATESQASTPSTQLFSNSSSSSTTTATTTTTTSSIAGVSTSAPTTDTNATATGSGEQDNVTTGTTPRSNTVYRPTQPVLIHLKVAVKVSGRHAASAAPACRAVVS
jgi:hypothetical protein